MARDSARVGGASEKISVRMPRVMIKALNELVRRGYYRSESEAVRHAVLRLLEQLYPDVYDYVRKMVGAELREAAGGGQP